MDTPPSPKALQIKKKFRKHFFINKVFEKMFVAVNKELLLTTGFLKFFINSQPLFTMNFKNFAQSLILFFIAHSGQLRANPAYSYQSNAIW